MCQCPLFKQFTTYVKDYIDDPEVFIVCVNVLFLSNSQLKVLKMNNKEGVYRMCQCPLFKQFTTVQERLAFEHQVFIVCVNVLFLSNSQHKEVAGNHYKGVYRMCQCPLFKQFTTDFA